MSTAAVSVDEATLVAATASDVAETLVWTASAAVDDAAPAPIEPPEAATATAVATMAVIDGRCWVVFMLSS